MDVHELDALKTRRAVTVSVCLPALNESATVGPICGAIRQDLMNATSLVDQLIVIDSGSTDGTAEVARSAGADVYPACDLIPEVPRGTGSGKGDTVWRSLSVAEGDILVWLDADTRNFDPRFVTDLIAPLLADGSIALVKAFYDRPFETDEQVLTTGGARVTELVVRPLLHLFYRELTGFIQPLAGECALRREVALDVPLWTGYALEIGLLLDLCRSQGLDALAQADLGVRVHRNQDVPALGRMAHQILQAMLVSFDELGRLNLEHDLPADLMQFVGSEEGPVAITSHLEVIRRPPMRELLT